MTLVLIVFFVTILSDLKQYNLYTLIFIIIELFLVTISIGNLMYHRHTVKLFAKIYDVYNNKTYNPLKKNERYFSTKTPHFHFISAIMWTVGLLITATFLSYQLYTLQQNLQFPQDPTEEYLWISLFIGLAIWNLIDLKSTKTYLEKHQFLEIDEINTIGSEYY